MVKMGVKNHDFCEKNGEKREKNGKKEGGVARHVAR
jgi:hypothetical protein